MTKKGFAMKDGGFPIVSKQDLKNAIQAYGRGDQPRAEKAHIIKRAKALKATNLIPDKWKKANEGFMDRFKASPIKLDGEHNTPEAVETAKYVLSLLKAGEIQASVSPVGSVKTIDKNINLATITPEGYVYIPGAGNWAPEEFSRNEKDILQGMLSCADGYC